MPPRLHFAPELVSGSIATNPPSSMKLLAALTLALVAVVSVHAQDTPPAPAQSIAPAAPAEVVQPAIPANALPSSGPASFTQDQVRQIETGLKKQMMLVGMGCGVVGILIGMMIGRKTASRSTVRRF
jgi:hypothetical protein